MVNQNLEVEEGGLYLIKIPQADRRNAINNQGVTGDAYVLMFIKQIDYGEQSMEFSYLVRTDDLQADTDGVINFNFQPDNGTDPEFNTEAETTPEVTLVRKLQVVKGIYSCSLTIVLI